MKAACQPSAGDRPRACSASKAPIRAAISGGATMAPRPVPAVMKPLAMLRSARGKPLGHHLVGGREIHGLGEAQRGPRGEEAADAAGKGMDGRGHAPPGHRERERPPAAEPVDHRPQEQLPGGVGGEEGKGDEPVLLVAEAELAADQRRRHGEREPVDVADHGDGAEHDRHPPALLRPPGRVAGHRAAHAPIMASRPVPGQRGRLVYHRRVITSGPSGWSSGSSSSARVR